MQNTLEAGRNQIIFTVVAMLLLAAILLVMLRMMAKDKLRKEQEAARAFHEKANTDALTGAKSTHAFSERETDINQKIRAHEPQELAVVVCDINGLKHVNDTQGHNAGDKLIVDAYRLICECFSSDAVLRIGGDEFVALLEGEATETLSGAFNELNRKVEANVKSGGVVVAAGYSKLNEEDGELRDVLDRADQIMYERKAELKDMGVWTRA
jgi:diguanylate cyclase (GGDEF)-like protein